MVGVFVLFYSDRKVALEIDLEGGEVLIPHFSAKKTKKEDLKAYIQEYFSVEIEGFDVIRREEDSLFLVVGEWEGNLKGKGPAKRFVWKGIGESVKTLTGEDKEKLTFFRKSYLEIVYGQLTLGIASKEECERLKLSRKGVTAFLNDDKGRVLVKHKGGIYGSLFTYIELDESPQEAVLRLLKEEYGTIAQMNLLFEEIYQKNGSINNHVFIGDHDQRLTFVNKEGYKEEEEAPEKTKDATKSCKNYTSLDFVEPNMLIDLPEEKKDGFSTASLLRLKIMSENIRKWQNA